jgi:purine-nucleoside phosphorylase
MTYTHADYENAARIIRSRTEQPVNVGLVLGSGLNRLADEISDKMAIPYADIPGCPRSTVPGHEGRLVIGTLEGAAVIAQQGRTHYYEGYDADEITFLIRIMARLGVGTVILTNAAGGLNTSFAVGDVMLINDHINVPGMAGNNPLRGAFNNPNEPSRFVGMTQAYDRELRQLAKNAANQAGITMREGVYVCVSGPNFETPAEVRMLRAWGADAVGMSTVHEVLVARHEGMRVLAFSGITNAAVDSTESGELTSHEEVLDAAVVLVPRMSAILRGVLRSL